MKITEQEVLRIADLGNLSLTEEEVRKYAADLAGILTYVEKLEELDTSEIEPMAQVIYEETEVSTLRKDERQKSLEPGIVLRSAPKAGEGQFKVPSVIER